MISNEEFIVLIRYGSNCQTFCSALVTCGGEENDEFCVQKRGTLCSKTRNFVLKMMNFAGRGSCSDGGQFSLKRRF